MIIEFSGMFGAGKTTQANLLAGYLRANGKKVIVYSEREIPFGGNFFAYNNAVLESLNQHLALFKKSKADCLILDRGYFDSGVWLDARRRLGHLNKKEHQILSQKLNAEKTAADKLIYTMIDLKTARRRRQKDMSPIDYYAVSRGFAPLIHQIFFQKVKGLPKDALVINAPLSIRGAFLKIKKYLLL